MQDEIKQLQRWLDNVLLCIISLLIIGAAYVAGVMTGMRL